jgi:hypothetical protein
MKQVLSWLVRSWLVMPVQEIFVQPWQPQSAQYTKHIFPHPTLFQFLCPHRPASCAGIRAGSPVSSYVSLIQCLCQLMEAERRGRYQDGSVTVYECVDLLYSDVQYCTYMTVQ